MSGTATRSLGTVLQKTSGTPLTIPNLTSIGEFGIENSEIDVTDLDSSGNFKEYLAGFKEPGELPLAGIVKNDTFLEALYALVNSQETVYWKLTTADGAAYWFQAYVKSAKEGEATPEGVRTWTGALRLTGEIVYAENGISA